MVQKGKFSAAADALVKTLKNVDFLKERDTMQFKQQIILTLRVATITLMFICVT